MKPDEIHALLNVSEENEEGKLQPLLNDEAKLMILVALLSGLRQAEEFGLMWPNIDFENNVIHVKQSLYWNFGKEQERNSQGLKYLLISPKSKYAVRSIDLSPELKKMLIEHRFKAQDKIGFIFQSSPGTPLNANNFYSRVFKVAVQAVGLNNFRWHDLRHTYGSLLLDQGEDLVYVSRQLGHSNVSITADIYSHLIRKQRPEAVAKLDKLLFGKS